MKKFLEFDLSPNLQEILVKNFFEEPTPVQIATIKPILEGKDLIVQSQTGSGKTLAFVLPMIELISRMNDINGINILIISPTRELAIQTYDLILKFTENTNFNSMLCIGGINRKKEERMLKNSPSIMIGTPGRLLDNIKSVENFRMNNLKVLIIDEFDKILDIGFEETIKKILKRLPNQRQNLLFSATINEKIGYIIKMIDPLYIKIEQENITNLKEYFIICKGFDRISILNTILKHNKKIIVFFNSCNSVIFHYNLFQYWRLKCWALHGNMKQNKRMLVFKEFGKSDDGILFCTDICARGIDISNITMIIQYDPPINIREYTHRIGRTARAGKKGKAILFIKDKKNSIIKEISKIKEKKVDFKEVNKKLYKLIENNYYIRELALNACKSYIQAYKGYENNIEIVDLDINEICKSFGFLEIPNGINKIK